MKNNPINIVWLKRDLRTQDHKPLQAAEQSGIPYFVVYLFEPKLIEYPDCSLRHLQFCYGSLNQMQTIEKNLSISICYGDAPKVFEYLINEFQINEVFSYQESGTQITWNRDKEVGKLFLENKIKWTEFEQDGVIRGIKNRTGWDKHFYDTIRQNQTYNTYQTPILTIQNNPFEIPDELKKELKNYPPNFQKPGEEFAWKYLASFMKDRGKRYHLDISKPAESRLSCGRISPYMAWGNISVKQVYHYVLNHDSYPYNKRAFTGFLGRIKWRCHFIQKFEVQCSYETKCVNKGYELLEHSANSDFLEKWKSGQTGFPMVDAAMRALHETGWINFRSRAMLVSFFCHHLDQDWKTGVYHLANLFLDYEPGIHYTQFQMQAGVTGINTIRIYNPVKLSEEKDPQAKFVLKWVPELAPLPLNFVHQPWKATPFDVPNDEFELGKNYPLPIINHEKSGSAAREKLWAYRKTEAVKQNKEEIVMLHTRNSKPKKSL